MRRILVTLAVVVGLALPAAAALYQHVYSTANSPVSVTSTAASTSFTDNQSNGTGGAFYARTVQVRSCGSATGAGCTAASTNTCSFHLGDSSADNTKDYPLEPGASVIVTFPRDRVNGDGIYGWSSITYKCANTETAKFRIDAWD